jgi:hypothetical protein
LDYGIMTPDGTSLRWVNPVVGHDDHPYEWFLCAEVSQVNVDDFIRALLSQNIVLGHNTPYDMCVLMANYPQLQRYVWDTYERDSVRDIYVKACLKGIAEGTIQFDPKLNKRPSYTLDELSVKYLGKKLDKDTWRLTYGSFDGIPCAEWPWGALHYATEDAITTFALYEHLGKYPDEWLQNRAALGLQLMSCWGMITDQEKVLELKRTLQANVSESRENLVNMGFKRDSQGNHPDGSKGKPYSTNKKFLQAAVERAYNNNPPRNDPTDTYPEGSIKTDQETLEDSGDSDLVYMASTLEEAKVLNDFIPTLQPQVNPRFYVLVATGRTSCRSPNTQQPPKFAGIRECFVPHDGWVYIQADISMAELCAIAQICYCMFGFSRMGDAIRADKDPHKIVGAAMLHMEYGEFNHIYRTADKDSEEYHKVWEARQFGKVGNFGTWGGLGAARLRDHAKGYGLVISESEAYNIKNLIKSTFPEQNLYFEVVSARGNHHSFRQFFSGRVRGDLRYTDGCNTQFQGLVADAAKEATYELQRAYYTLVAGYEALYGCRVVNFIHDEWISEAPAEKAEEVARSKSRLLESVVQRWIPDLPIRIDSQILDCWRKT